MSLLNLDLSRLDSDEYVAAACLSRLIADAEYVTSLSYIPLVAPSTPDDRMKMLCSITDSFVYVVPRMGVTGALKSLDPGLNQLLDRVRVYTENRVSTVVGFGINTREHFVDVAQIANGVAIGSKVISVIRDAPEGTCA